MSKDSPELAYYPDLAEEIRIMNGICQIIPIYCYTNLECMMG